MTLEDWKLLSIIRLEVALNQSWMSWCAVINCNNKAKTKNREVSYFRLSKDTSVHKD